MVVGVNSAGAGEGSAEVGGGLKCWSKPLGRVQWEDS